METGDFMQIEANEFRQSYPRFLYRDFTIEQSEGEILLTFHFEIPGLATFSPSTKIFIEDERLLNPVDDAAAKSLVFSLGMTEAVSYFKAVCPQTLEVLCGSLNKEEISFWKKLYFGGLGEFLYRNGLETDEESFIEIQAKPPVEKRDNPQFHKTDIAILPIGGGKDSAVTAELLKRQKIPSLYFTVNDQKARKDTVLASGGSEKDILRTERGIDPKLLELNREGFLNGHTPFSAIVAFLSAYIAYLTGATYIVLSNESSANESNIQGASVNHQYSKSYEFEKDFRQYLFHLGVDMEYFSLLRPFHELQIASFFSSLPQYHAIFRSCNAGSKKNIWCGACAKCLFVYCILSPFIEKEELDKIFGENLAEKKELLPIFRGLVGFDPVKPFECVGTIAELKTALHMTIQNYRKKGISLPYLFDFFAKEDKGKPNLHLLSDFNQENAIPKRFLPCVKEMYAYVSKN